MIKLLSLDQYCDKLPLVISPNFFVGNSKDQYDPEGLFSEKIFGMKNSPDWSTKEGKIELKTKIFNPIVFKLLYRLNRKLYEALKNNEPFEIKDDGSINFKPDNNNLGGINYLISKWDIIKFDENNSSIRKKLIEYIKDPNNRDKIFISSLLVIPPKFRPIYEMETSAGLMYDELNDYYIKVIKKVKANISNSDNNLFKMYTLSIQLTINDIYDYVKLKLGKKTGYIRGNLLGKRTDFSGRSVITGDSNLPPDRIAVPFRMIINIYKPFMIHAILNNPVDYWNELTKDYGGNYTVKTIENVIDAIVKGYTIDPKIYKHIRKLADQELKDKVVLMKRDPALHRESWQAYYFTIWDGDTIKLSPSTVGSHNADFDGDSICGTIVLNIKEVCKNIILKENQKKLKINILDIKNLEIEIEKV